MESDHETFYTYSTFQSYLDSQFRKDLYHALDTNDLGKLMLVRLRERNLPFWLLESIFNYARERGCKKEIIKFFTTIPTEIQVEPWRLSISKGDILGGWKVKDILYDKDVEIDIFAENSQKALADFVYNPPKITHYVMEKYLEEDEQ